MGMSDAENNDKMDIGQTTVCSNQNLAFNDNNDNNNNERNINDNGTTHEISNNIKNNNNNNQITDHQQEQNQHQQQNEQHKHEQIQSDKHTVHWFRKGLRLHDNPALIEGLKGATTFRCVFIIDPWFAGSSNVGINKWRFLLQCLEDLDRSLRNLNSRLFVIRGQPADALPKLFKEWNTTCLTFEEDPEPFGRVRDHNITEMCKELGIGVISAVSHTLYKLEKIIEKNNGRAPLTYNQFQAIIASMDPPQPAQAVITQETLDNAYTPFVDDHDEKFGVPTLEELGFDIDCIKPPVWIGGETEALTRLERHLERKAWVASFGRPKMTPQSLQASQTGLSPYLRFGCLSTRLFYHQLTDLYKKIKNAYPPLSLHGQLLWREFFYCAATKNPNFDKMASNPICVQIPWDTNADALAKWANGHTGFPWIDAIMTQLREEGWIHHLARHAVACFLTRGDLWVSWEEGMKVFEELLLDADWSVNAGMWMWLSCSSFFQQFFHCYCPVRFGRKADPNGDYIRKYLPVLKNFPTKYIHEPWNAPESVQRTAKCIIGREYSLPMVNHAVASRTNMERMKQVYQQLAKYRNSNCSDGSNKGDSVIFGMLAAAKAQSGAAVTQMSSPSPSTIIARVNNSGNLICRSNPIPTVTVNNHLESNQQQSSNTDNMNNESNNNNIIVNTVHGQQTNNYVKNLLMTNQQQESLGNIQQIVQQQHQHQQKTVPKEYIQQQYFKNITNAEMNAKIQKNFVEEENHQNSQYNRIILHRNVVYNLNNSMHEQLSMDNSINYQNQSDLNLHSTNMIFSNNNPQNDTNYRNGYKIESNIINESQNYNNYKFTNSNEQNNYNISVNDCYDGSQNRSPSYFDKRQTIINHHQVSPNDMSDMKQLQIDENDETKLNLSVNIGCNLSHNQ